MGCAARVRRGLHRDLHRSRSSAIPILDVFKPALLATALTIGLWLLQQYGQAPRRPTELDHNNVSARIGDLERLVGPFALNQGVAFQFWINFVRTVVMTLVIASSVRNARDLSRLMFVYWRCDCAVHGSGGVPLPARWRRHLAPRALFYYDANDMATLIANCDAFRAVFLLGQRRPIVRILAGVGLAVLAWD